MKLLATLTLGICLVQICAWGQTSTAPEGVAAGNYQIQQSVELGWRYTTSSGNGSIYDTFVNLHTGPRLLEQSLEVQSVNHAGALFDNLSLASFGYGGDPNSATRLRMYRNRWYNFNASFRRDQNFWDYNLLANPLNPPTSSPSLAVQFSPHRFATVRRMSDYNLALAPQARVRARLAYSRNVSQGPSFSSVNVGGFQGAQTLLAQPWHETQDQYQIGVDFKLLPRTSISFDQFFQFRKDDTSLRDGAFAFQLSNGAPVDLGLVFNTPFFPCASPIGNGATSPPTANDVCNGFLSFSRANRVRSRTPTEQLTLQSTYFRRLELSGLFSYSRASSSLPAFAESFDGLIVPLNLRQDALSGVAGARRIAVTGEVAATWQVAPQWRISDALDWRAFRIPGDGAAAESALFAASLLASPSAFNPATCPAPFVSPACPQHGFGSPADLIASRAAEFLGQREIGSFFNVERDFSRHWGGQVGYRYTHKSIAQRGEESNVELLLPPLADRDDCANQPLAADGSCAVTKFFSLLQRTPIQRHSVLLGAWSRLLADDRLRMNFDVELFAADRVFDRIEPRQRQRYRFRARYKPAAWANISLGFGLSEGRNGANDVKMREHGRNADVSLSLIASDKWAADINYDFNSGFSRSMICYISETAGAGGNICPSDPGLFLTTSFYDSATHFGRAAATWHPQRRVTANLGYTITSADGDTALLNPLASIASLRYNLHQPAAALAIDLRQGLTWKASWNYHDYNEKSDSGPTLPRDFHANLATVALRYSF